MARCTRKSRLLTAARWAVLASILLPAIVQADDERRVTVGMAGRIDQVVLPGSELEVRPLEDRRLPIVLRITGVYPHGTAHRYDLVYYGLDPGTFDLRDYLRRKDGSKMDAVPPLRVSIESVLPAGQIQPHQPEPNPPPSLGGYRLLLLIAAALWLVGLVAILVVGRHRRLRAHAALRPVTLADRLRPLVERAMAGTLTQPERAELERLLLSYWRQRLHLSETKPAEAFASLRRHREAGPLLMQLEAWLHRPEPPEPVNLTALLEPYRHAAPPEPAAMGKA